jgi:hypothetical protein
MMRIRIHNTGDRQWGIVCVAGQAEPGEGRAGRPGRAAGGGAGAQAQRGRGGRATATDTARTQARAHEEEEGRVSRVSATGQHSSSTGQHTVVTDWIRI